MVQFIKMLIHINKTPIDEIPSLFESKDTYEFFKNKFILVCMKYILATRTFQNQTALRLANMLLENSVKLFNQNISKDIGHYAEAAACVLDANRNYYQMNNQTQQFLKPVHSFP